MIQMDTADEVEVEVDLDGATHVEISSGMVILQKICTHDED